jgi:hypothetical protein
MTLDKPEHFLPFAFLLDFNLDIKGWILFHCIFPGVPFTIKVRKVNFFYYMSVDKTAAEVLFRCTYKQGIAWLLLKGWH